MAKTSTSEQREYKTPEMTMRQKKQGEAKGDRVTRRGNKRYLKE